MVKWKWMNIPDMNIPTHLNKFPSFFICLGVILLVFRQNIAYPDPSPQGFYPGPYYLQTARHADREDFGCGQGPNRQCPAYLITPLPVTACLQTDSALPTFPLGSSVITPLTLLFCDSPRQAEQLPLKQ